MTQNKFIIGKAADIIPPAAKGIDSISRQHLSVETTETPGLYRLVDLHSTNHSYYYDPGNGRWVEFQKLRAEGTTLIRMGDYVTRVKDLLTQTPTATIPVELQLIPGDLPKTYRIVCSVPAVITVCNSKGDPPVPFRGQTVIPESQIRIGARSVQVSTILQNSVPFRNSRGEICYTYTL